MNLKLDDKYIDEVFEILCEIPFEAPTMSDSEPPTTRHPGIEQLLEQLRPIYNRPFGEEVQPAHLCHYPGLSGAKCMDWINSNINPCEFEPETCGYSQRV